MPRRFQREAPLRQLVRDGPGVFVVAGPFDRLAAATQRLGKLARALTVALAQALQRAGRFLAAVHARGSEEDDGVLDVLLLQAAERLEVFRENADRARIVALEELRIHVGEG